MTSAKPRSFPKTPDLPDWRRAFDAMHHGEVIKSVLVPGSSAA